jgi:ent-kaurene synthase
LVRKHLINFLSCFVDPFTRFLQEDHFSSTLGGYLKDIGAVLELFRASEIIIHPDESVLEKQNSLTRHFLRRELSNGSIHTDRLNKHLVQEVRAVKPLSLIY